MFVSLPLPHPQSLLCDEQLANCPVLILGNKIDKQGALGEDDLRAFFNLNGQTTGKVSFVVIVRNSTLIFVFPFQGRVSRSELPGRPLELFMCSVLRRQGYGEGFRWLSQYL